MGFSWAMWAAHAVHEELVVCSGVEGVPLSDRGYFVQMERNSAKATYVENFACFALDLATAKKGRDRVRECAVAHGLICHEDFEGSDFEFLGHHFKGDLCFVTWTHSRFWKLDRALDGFIRRGRCSGDQLRVIVGHVTWAFMLRRPMLSMLSAAYRFQMQKGVVRLWPSVVRELSHARSLLPFCRVSPSKSVHDRVYVSDACEIGYALASTLFSDEQTRTVRTCDERWCFTQADAPGAREQALQSEDIVLEAYWESGFKPLRFADVKGPWELHCANQLAIFYRVAKMSSVAKFFWLPSFPPLASLKQGCTQLFIARLLNSQECFA